MSFLCYNWNWLKKKVINHINELSSPAGRLHLCIATLVSWAAPIHSTSQLSSQDRFYPFSRRKEATNILFLTFCHLKQSNLFNGLKQKQHIRMLLDRAFTAPIQSTSKHTYIGDIIRKICECDLWKKPGNLLESLGWKKCIPAVARKWNLRLGRVICVRGMRWQGYFQNISLSLYQGSDAFRDLFLYFLFLFWCR